MFSLKQNEIEIEEKTQVYLCPCCHNSKMAVSSQPYGDGMFADTAVCDTCGLNVQTSLLDSRKSREHIALWHTRVITQSAITGIKALHILQKIRLGQIEHCLGQTLADAPNPEADVADIKPATEKERRILKRGLLKHCGNIS